MYLGGFAGLSLPWSWKVAKAGIERLEFLHIGLFLYALLGCPLYLVTGL